MIFAASIGQRLADAAGMDIAQIVDEKPGPLQERLLEHEIDARAKRHTRREMCIGPLRRAARRLDVRCSRIRPPTELAPRVALIQITARVVRKQFDQPSKGLFRAIGVPASKPNRAE